MAMTCLMQMKIIRTWTLKTEATNEKLKATNSKIKFCKNKNTS